MIISDAFFEYAKRETNLGRLGAIVRILAGGECDDVDETTRILADTFIADSEAKTSNIEARREKWRRDRAEDRKNDETCPTDKNLSERQKTCPKDKNLSERQKTCPKDKNLSERQNPVRQTSEMSALSNQPSNHPSNQPTIQPSILPVGKPPGNARAQARPRASSAPPDPPGNISSDVSSDPSPSAPTDEISSIFADAARRMRNRDGHETPIRVDYGTIFSDADPVILALSLTGTDRRDDRRAFGALLKAVGDKRFRDTLATLYGEMRSGEVPDNPVGALIAKLRAIERTDMENDQ